MQRTGAAAVDMESHIAAAVAAAARPAVRGLQGHHRSGATGRCRPRRWSACDRDGSVDIARRCSARCRRPDASAGAVARSRSMRGRRARSYAADAVCLARALASRIFGELQLDVA